MKRNEFFRVMDENGKVLAIRKTRKGIDSWKMKHRVEKCGFQYTMNGKSIWIDWIVL